MQAILDDPTARARYEELKAAAEPLAGYETSTCAKEVGIMAIIVLATIAIVGATLLLSLLVARALRRRSRP
jgi:hypothetical protein